MNQRPRREDGPSIELSAGLDAPGPPEPESPEPPKAEDPAPFVDPAASSPYRVLGRWRYERANAVPLSRAIL